MSRCKGETKSGKRCKNKASDGSDFCHIHLKSDNEIQHPKKRAMISALESSLGVVTTAAKNVGIDRTTHYRWLNEDSTYKEAVNDIDNVTIDFAESQLFKQIKDGNTTATIFFLKTRGKKRGYVEQINFNIDDTKKALTDLDSMIRKQAELDR